MSKKVLLLHGWGGSDYPHWQSWLASEIARNYGCVNFLRFSDFNKPKLEIWLDEAKKALDDFSPDIVICHSLANTLWFHLCNKEELSEVEKLYLVAPPSMECLIEDIAEFFPIIPPQKLYAKEALLITSTDDPYMTVKEAQNLQNELNVPMKVIEKGGHLNSASGYGEWPWILEHLQGAN